MSDPTLPTRQKAHGVDYWTVTWSDPRKPGERRGRAHMRRFGRCDRVSHDKAMRLYRRWIAKVFPGLKSAAKAGYSINQLAKDYFAQMTKRYVIDGKHTTSITRIRIALESFGAMYGGENAEQMTAGKVAMWLEHYINERLNSKKESSEKNKVNAVGSDMQRRRGKNSGGPHQPGVVREAGLSRMSNIGNHGDSRSPKPRTKETCNLALTYVKRMYRWGAKYGKVSDAAAGAVQLAENLRSDHPETRKKPAIRPVTWETVEQTQKFCPPILSRLIDVLWLTGMRPGEGMMMRPCDIELLPEPISDLNLTARPLGAVGSASANRGESIHVYTPRRHKNTHKGKVRKIVLGPKAWRIIEPLLPTKTDTAIFPIGMKSGNLSKFIERRAKRAGVEKWNLNQIRHSYATRVEDQFGADAVQATLGHSNLNTQRVYIEKSLRKAMEVARECG